MLTAVLSWFKAASKWVNWLGRLLTSWAAILGVLVALPAIYTTYSCVSSGKMCQYALFGPSSSAVESSIASLAEDFRYKGARFEASPQFSRLEGKRIELYIKNGDDRRLTFVSDPSFKQAELFVSDDKLSALAVERNPKANDESILSFQFIDELSEMLVRRSFLLRCTKGDFRAGTNFTFDPTTRMIAFDLAGGCSYGTLNSSSLEIQDFERYSRIFIELDELFVPVNMYPNYTSKKPKTPKQLEEDRARSDEFDLLYKAAAEEIEKCLSGYSAKEGSSGKGSIKLCDAPRVELAEYYEYPRINMKGVVAIASNGSVSTEIVYCPADQPIKVVRDEDAPLVLICDWNISMRNLHRVLFVSDEMKIRKFDVGCDCLELEIGAFKVESDVISFEVYAPSTEISVEWIPVKFSDANASSYRSFDQGRVSVTFSESGWPKSARLIGQ